MCHVIYTSATTRLQRCLDWRSIPTQDAVLAIGQPAITAANGAEDFSYACASLLMDM